ncbi:MAG: translocase FtsK protein [candidate division WWE3 bacterium GW2011_GWF1_42_14]|uniref:Translocase FtsK protein n=2 Tax=Katanobacteria TaxID=422282 RepID=A0A0G1BIE9_UNCKA|nr:MAG: translocase FtsK protein [candidate division WWE3 bacterium GW2011_GWA1_42_12]KKS34019.1 MAG: translocase FtsK protein [candidate division WWE3 bacterium GW2011_GWD1_42_14]KKS37208.1 MAG: translocase FtsK protein [candidate division WWE3 bacterium GW2011_GWF1_42_14]KKS40069.1 MAG: translocase FtsK protein [candidate division WWE3 bacterium GW2011_GWE1_42_16]KKS66753.1 MAG: translocase FtsK protein [candidate division WWE3 bacterium GW2011_GWB1_42_6]
MPKRGRKRKFKLNFSIKPDTIRSVIALTLVTVGLLSLIAYFVPSYSVNAKIKGFMTGLFGKPSIILPFLFLISGSLFIQKLKVKLKEPRIVAGLVLALLGLSGLSHVFIKRVDALEAAENGLGGGMVGYEISSFLISAVSIYGAAVLLILAVLISTILLFDVSLDQVLGFVSEKKDLIKSPLKGMWPFKKEDTGEFEEISEDEFNIDGKDRGNTEDASAEAYGDGEETEENPEFEVIPSQYEPVTVPVVIPEGATSTIATISPPPFLVTPSNKIWKEPPLDILIEPVAESRDSSETKANEKKIVDTLKSFAIDVEVANTKVGPSVTRYAIKTKSVAKVSKIASLHENLALALASPNGSVRIEAPIPGTSEIGIEVPNIVRSVVNFKSIITSEAMKSMKTKLAIGLGKDVAGKTYVYDIAKMPHILIAGATNSGKSIFIHNILFSILFRASPQEVKFILVDPKRNELIHYQNIPHLITPVVVDMEKTPAVFKWAVQEMERRLKLFEQARVRNLDAYNENSGFQALPYIVIVVDEFAEVMMQDSNSVEKAVVRLAQMARSTGIHLVLAVQRPSINIITGIIKANIPTRVAFSVASQMDSRVIIDQPGAEKLLTRGDMLFVPPDAQKPIRLQGAYIDTKEIERLVNYLTHQGVEPDYLEEVLSMAMEKDGKTGSSSWGDGLDPLFDEAVDIVSSMGKASASLLQRKLSIGFSRAARIIDEMETKGIVGPAAGGSRARELLTGSMSSYSDELDDLVS